MKRIVLLMLAVMSMSSLAFAAREESMLVGETITLSAAYDASFPDVTGFSVFFDGIGTSNAPFIITYHNYSADLKAVKEGVFKVIASTTRAKQVYTMGGWTWSYWDATVEYIITVRDLHAIVMPSNLTLHPGDSYQFTPAFIPAEAQTSVTWSSSNESIVAVDGNGLVTAIAEGVSTITCAAPNGTYAVCNITVEKIKVINITLPSQVRLHLAETYTFVPDISPANAQSEIFWKSNNEEVAGIDNNGKVTAYGVGTATITCYADNGISCNSTVVVDPWLVSNLSMNLSKCWVTETDSVILQPVIQPDNATTKKLRWSSSDPTIAGVNSKGRVIALKAGKCVITATATDGSGVSTQCDLRVVARGEGVMPMLRSLWSQSTPFDLNCPTDNDKPLPPGSAAIALGQILNYHRTLDSGFGKASYTNTSADGSAAGTITVDFDNLSFDWANILDQYTYGYYKRSTNGNAVANLISQAGAALMTMYRPEGSVTPYDGAALYGLHHYLHLASNSIKHYRIDYATADWTAMIDNELDNNRPILYGGARFLPQTRTYEDYAFVIDGRNRIGGIDYYHVNFGDGTSPKYVTLETLNQTGTTPGGYGKCWHLSQWMYFKAKQDKNDTYSDVGLISCVPPVVNNNPEAVTQTLNRNQQFHLRYTMGLYGVTKTSMEYALGFFQRDELKGISYPSTNADEKATAPAAKSLGVGEEKEYRHYYYIPQELSAGAYVARLIARPRGTSAEWSRWLEMAPSGLTVNVSATEAIINLPANRRAASPALSLTSDIEIVANEFEAVQPGTAVRLAFKGDEMVNFQDTIKFKISIEGDANKRTFKTMAAVYSQTEPTYDFLIPSSMLNLQGKTVKIKAYYYNRAHEEYVELLVPQPEVPVKKGDINNDDKIDVSDLTILINIILGMDNAENYNGRANLSGNATIDVTDLDILISTVLGK